VKSGGLVNDEIVINIMKEKMKMPGSEKGVILDGVPRTLN
jgi:adenylate kinase